MASRLITIATIAAVVAAAVLRATDRPVWEHAFVVALALVGVRLALMVRAAARRELPWSRLLLPGLIVLGLWWSVSPLLWQVRAGAAAVLELAFVVVAIRELRRTAAGAEPLEARIATSLGALLPPGIARLAAFELVIVGSAMRFLFGGWRRAVPAGFTYHRDSGLRMLLMLLPLLALGDVLLLELVLLRGSAIWLRVVVHVLALYGVIWLIGLYASARARPHRLADGVLALHRGMLKRLAVPVDQIASIDALPSFADDWKKRAYCKGALRIDLAGPAILELRLRSPVRPSGVFGEGAAGTRVLVAVDDPASFIAAVEPSPIASAVTG